MRGVLLEGSAARRIAQVLLAGLILLVALTAWAGESRFLGTIFARGASTTNLTTQASLSDGGLLSNAFAIPFGAKLTLECDNEMRMLTDAALVSLDGGIKGVRVPANMLFQTSTGAPTGIFDAGFPLPVSVIAIVPTGADVSCDFWQRSGIE